MARELMKREEKKKMETVSREGNNVVARSTTARHRRFRVEDEMVSIPRVMAGPTMLLLPYPCSSSPARRHARRCVLLPLRRPASDR